MATQEQVDKAVKSQVGGIVSGLSHTIKQTVEEALQQNGHGHGHKHDAEHGAPADSDTGKFKVTGPGYSEQFTSKKSALASFDSLKKRLLKNEQAATVRLSTQGRGAQKWEVVQELKLNEDHY
jgi:hypothetical protein